MSKRGIALITQRKKGWKTIQLPQELLQRVDEIVEKSEIGYISRSEFIKEAVRLRVETIETQMHDKKKQTPL